MEGLQGIRARAFLHAVIRRVRIPIREAANAASAPECPPPTTITEKESKK